jgi:large subunit ribosomal protein L25
MERIQIRAEARPVSTRGRLRRFRGAGLIPGIIYGRGKEAVPVVVDGKDLVNVLALPTGMNTLVDLTVDGERDTVMIRELVREILYQDRFSHVDFLRISLNEKLEVQVPVHLTGEAEGVREGGILQQAMREVILKCLPTEIPEQVELDISNLAVGQSLTVADLAVGAAMEIVSDPSELVVTVLAPRIVEEEPAEDAPAAEGGENREES